MLMAVPRPHINSKTIMCILGIMYKILKSEGASYLIAFIHIALY